MRGSCILLFALLAATPAVAQTDASEQRIADAQRQLELHRQQQQIGELENRVFELEQQLQTRENLQSLDQQARQAPVFLPLAPLSPLPRLSGTETSSDTRSIDAAMAANNERLQALADQINN